MRISILLLAVHFAHALAGTTPVCSSGTQIVNNRKCTTSCGFDRVGGDYSSKYTGSFQKCVNDCAVDTKCVTAQYHEKSGYCYFKSGGFMAPHKAAGIDTVDCAVAAVHLTTTTIKTPTRSTTTATRSPITNKTTTRCTTTTTRPTTSTTSATISTRPTTTTATTSTRLTTTTATTSFSTTISPTTTRSTTTTSSATTAIATTTIAMPITSITTSTTTSSSTTLVTTSSSTTPTTSTSSVTLTTTYSSTTPITTSSSTTSTTTTSSMTPITTSSTTITTTTPSLPLPTNNCVAEYFYPFRDCGCPYYFFCETQFYFPIGVLPIATVDVSGSSEQYLDCAAACDDYHDCLGSSNDVLTQKCYLYDVDPAGGFDDPNYNYGQRRSGGAYDTCQNDPSCPV